MSNGKDKRVMLEKYLKDPTIKLLWSDTESSEYKRYKFLVSTAEYENEVRYSEAFFMDNGETVSLSRSTSKRQKFLCVDGPLAGQKVIEENAIDYVLFNRSSSRGDEDGGIPSAILVYRQSVTQ